MYFLLSGEGATDMGRCTNKMATCEGPHHEPGPMAVIVSKIVEQRMGFSILENLAYGFVSKDELARKASLLKHQKKSPSLPGVKRRKETTYFRRDARALAGCAIEKRKEINDDDIIAVLFRDSDGTASAGRGLWKDKWDSMARGFSDEGFEKGVPMIPKPKSEAWIICCVKNNRYRNCAALEYRSGNDKSPNSLKVELAEIRGALPSRQQLCDMVNDGTIDVDRIDMPSFLTFKQALLDRL